MHIEYKVGFLLSLRVLQRAHLSPAGRFQGQSLARRSPEPLCTTAALTGALVCPALFCIQIRLPGLVSVDLWLISFEKGDRNGHEGLGLIFIFRQIFTTLNNYQEKEASAVNKLWTRNSNTIKIQTVRSGDCRGSVKWNAQGFLNSISVLSECVPSIHPPACRYHLPPSVKNLSVTCCTSLTFKTVHIQVRNIKTGMRNCIFIYIPLKIWTIMKTWPWKIGLR